jgi:cytochrome b
MERLVYIWSLPIRVFHWALVLLIVGLFYTSFYPDMLTYHVSCGAAVFVLLVFRLVWGYFGSRYAKFENFDFDLINLITHFKYFNQNEKAAGHHAASSYMTLLLLITLFCAIVTGVLSYGIVEGRGMLAHLNGVYYKDMLLFSSLHTYIVYFLLFLVVLHIGGVILHAVATKNRTVIISIITGYKKNVHGSNIELSTFKKSIAALFFVIAGAFYALTYRSESVDLDPYVYQNSDFMQECKRCHMLYPPYLLNSSSWVKMMDELSDHFGDDASVDEEKYISIKEYLVAHSASVSKREAGVKILQSISDNEYLSITDTPFWKEQHDDIDITVFNSDKVESKSKCTACHLDIKNGHIEDKNINLPK